MSPGPDPGPGLVDRPRGERQPGQRSPGRALSRLGVTDREVLGWWAITRLGLLAVLAMAPAVFAPLNAPPGSTPSLGLALTRWDAVHFATIAQYGYTPGVPAAQQPTGVPLEAFFPGFPGLLAAFHVVGLPYALTGVLSGLVFGAVAAIALARLARLEPGADADPALGSRAALLWMLAPVAVFVAVPYSEAPFLGLAFPAWLAARHRRWWLACLLAAGASCFRISGLYLAVALAVQFLVTQLGDRGSARARRDWRLVPLFVVPVLPIVGFFAYLWAASGNPRLWFDVQAQVWNRTFTLPWDSVATTWASAFGQHQAPDYAWMFGAELVALAVGTALTVVLLIRRRWAEACFVGLQLISYATSYWLMSVPRAGLIWWPLWTMAAVALGRRPWLLRGWLVVSGSLAAVWAAAFLRSQWAG